MAKVNSDPINKSANFLMSLPERIISFKINKNTYLILVVLGILLLAIVKKSWFISATVNGAPITNLELQMKLNEQFKDQILNQIINEKIILQEASKNGVTVNDFEINQKISSIETQVGGKDTLNTMLSQQGQTRNSLRDQIMLQLIISKLYEKEATFSAEQLQQFIDANKQVLTATDSAGLEKEAADQIKQQKLTQIFSQKFQELRQKANIKIF